MKSIQESLNPRTMNNFPNTRSHPLSSKQKQTNKQNKRSENPIHSVIREALLEKCDFKRGGRKYLLWKFLLLLVCVLQIDRGRRAFGECKERIYWEESRRLERGIGFNNRLSRCQSAGAEVIRAELSAVIEWCGFIQAPSSRQHFYGRSNNNGRCTTNMMSLNYMYVHKGDAPLCLCVCIVRAAAQVHCTIIRRRRSTERW